MMRQPARQDMRTRRSLTAFLAAEVFLLESILAAQTGKKYKSTKVKAGKVLRPVTYQHQHTVGSSNSLYPPLQRPTTTQPPFKLQTSQLDPFTMLAPPDLGNNMYKISKEQEELLYKTSDVMGRKREARQESDIVKYGEYEVYYPTIVTTQRYGAYQLYTPSKEINANLYF